jgi:hypothetical protein
VYATSNSVALVTKTSVMICAIFAAGLPPAARPGAQVLLEGTIDRVEGKTSVTVVGERLKPAT